MDIAMQCPVCRKRAFDASRVGNAERPLEISLKCPHCRNIVRVPIAEHMRLPIKRGGVSRQHISR